MKKIIILLALCTFTWLQAQTFEIKFDVNNAGGWFGGDDRPTQIRNVAVAQSVFIEFPITLQSFAFYFASPFDFVQNPTGTGHEVSLRMHIRDSAGVVLDTVEVTVADTFSGGWISWSNIDFELFGPSKYIFSTYLIGGYDSIKVHSSQRCDLNAGYLGGERFSKYVINDSDAVAWSDWSQHVWDSNFWLVGLVKPTAVQDNINVPAQFNLEQNYPNPFNPSTKISWQSPVGSWQTLKVYDVLGNEVVTLVNEYKPAGNYEVNFDASELASGIYLYKVQTGNFIDIKKMILLR
jgi:hypothetical protein